MEAKDLIVYILAGGGALSGGTSLYQDTREVHLEPRLAVVETKVAANDKKLDEVKEGVKDNGKKLDGLKDLIIQRR